MGDDFRVYGLRDVERMSKLIGVELAWLRDLRHSATEPMDNEKARTQELSDALLAFNNERLAGNGGTRWEAVAGPPPIMLEAVISNQDVEDILAQIPGYGKTIHRITLDSNYYLCSKEGVQFYLGWSTIDKIPYTPDRQDCDDFAAEVFGEFRQVYQFGNIGLCLDWSSAHAYCFAVFANGDLWWIEPQNDGTVKTGQAPYKLENALLII